MTKAEFEERLRALEAQHQEDIALMNAAHEARVRSLHNLLETAAPAPTPPASVRQPASKPRREPNSVFNDLSEALPSLPLSFDKHDIVRALGYEPSRATLFRALRALSKQGMIDTESSSIGGATSRYRKL